MKDNRCTIEKTLIAPKENGTRTEALQKLFDNPDKVVLAKNLRAEIPVFQFYINVAIRNIQDIAGTVVGTQDFAPDKIVEKLTPDGKLYENQSQDKKEAVRRAVEKLADFFWLFQVDDPGKDYKKDYAKYTRAIAKRLYMLRNYFCHINESGIDALLTDHDFYTFFAGELCNTARDKACGPGMKTDKLFKMKVMNPFEKAEPAKGFENDEEVKELCDKVRKDCRYFFTRRGLILLVCMGLYRDEAVEFCQSLQDLNLKAVGSIPAPATN